MQIIDGKANNYKFGKISREAFIGLKDQLEESTEENNKRIKVIDKKLKESGTIESLTEDVVAKYIKTIYISSKGIEKIEYCQYNVRRSINYGLLFL